MKSDVPLYGLNIKMRVVLIEAERAYLEHAKVESFIVHTVDGIHSPGSLHPYGYAIDYRTNFLTADQKKNIFDDLVKSLPKGFDVVWHETHIHVEYDDAKKL